MNPIFIAFYTIRSRTEPYCWSNYPSGYRSKIVDNWRSYIHHSIFTSTDGQSGESV